MEIIEINKITIADKPFLLCDSHIIDVNELDRNNGFIKVSFDFQEIDIPLYFDPNSVTIYSENDFQNLLINFGLQNIDIRLLRFKIINTKKWGWKIIYEEGADAVSFNCYYKIINNETIIIFYNTSGTRWIEYLYLHGIWKIKNEE